jgi:hypothetical protein
MNSLSSNKFEEVIGGTYKADSAYQDGYELRIGFRAWTRNKNNVETEITDGTPSGVCIITDTEFDSYVNTTYNFASLNLTDGMSFKIRIYTSTDEYPSWSLLFTFQSEGLSFSKAEASIWTVYYYVWLQREEDLLDYQFRCGSATYPSRIENIQFDNGIIPLDTETPFSEGFIFGCFLLGITAFAAILLYTKH